MTGGTEETAEWRDLGDRKRESGVRGMRVTGPPAWREGHSQQGGLESC